MFCSSRPSPKRPSEEMVNIIRHHSVDPKINIYIYDHESMYYHPAGFSVGVQPAVQTARNGPRVELPPKKCSMHSMGILYE